MIDCPCKKSFHYYNLYELDPNKNVKIDHVNISVNNL